MGPRERFLRAAGFTLLEILVVVAILAVIASIAIPQYSGALLAARMQKAKQELRTIANAIDMYRSQYGSLPLTLHQVGFGGRRDPWGVPYCYLNYTDGTGDGLDWAVRLGIVDPAAVRGGSSSTNLPSAGNGAGAPSLVRGVGGISAAPGTINADLTTTVLGELPRELSFAESQAISAALQNGKTQLYVGVTVESVRRRDRYMFPLNTDYDLFSLGPNRSTTVSLGQSLAQDDVIRANDGGFYGAASEY